MSAGTLDPAALALAARSTSRRVVRAGARHASYSRGGATRWFTYPYSTN